MSELRDLYQQVILDHNKSPRNFGPLADATRSVEGFNPLCGDHYTVHLRLEGDVVAAVTFEGAGCAISKASASVMCSTVKGKSRSEVEALVEAFHALVTGKRGGHSPREQLGKLEAFAGVSEYPARVKCASLPWHTLRAALVSDTKKVSTE